MDDPDREALDDPRQIGVRVRQWYTESDHWAKQLAVDLVVALTIVAVLGTVLFAASGIWPPLVAVESGSMSPNIQEGDLVFVVDTDRYVHTEASGDGIVPTGQAVEHERFNRPGTVIVFQPDGTDTPIIHRAKLHVEAGEDWTERADPAAMRSPGSCDQTPACPAPHDGYITKGDDNEYYDVDQGQSVVRPEWIHGKAAFRIPYLGYVRLALEPGQWPHLVPGATASEVRPEVLP